MFLSNKEELYKIVEQLPEEKLKLVIAYAKKIQDDNVYNDKFADGIEFLFDNYDETLRELKDR